MRKPEKYGLVYGLAMEKNADFISAERLNHSQNIREITIVGQGDKLIHHWARAVAQKITKTESYVE